MSNVLARYVTKFEFGRLNIIHTNNITEDLSSGHTYSLYRLEVPPNAIMECNI